MRALGSTKPMLGREAGLLALIIVLAAACEPNNQDYQPAQPVNYSHALHAGELEMPCGYCHFGAEQGRYAGIPPNAVCMNCHTMVKPDSPEIQKLAKAKETNKPIEWVRVHWLPDHVYFNHSVHVNAGFTCQTCHGPVETMAVVKQWAPVTMGWCVNCHRDNAPEDVLSAPGASPQSNRLTDCATCHH